MAMEPGGTIRTSDDAAVDRIAGAFADIVDARSPFTGSHSQHVADIAGAIATRLGLPLLQSATTTAMATMSRYLDMLERLRWAGQSGPVHPKRWRRSLRRA